MASPARPESSVHAVGDGGKFNFSPEPNAAAANAVPSREGLAQIRSSEAQNVAAVKGLPPIEVTPPSSPSPLSDLGKIEAVVVGAGATLGAVGGAAVGHFIGGMADIAMKATGNVGPDTFAMGDPMMAAGGGVGLTAGAAGGGLVGGLLWAGYEIIKPQPAY